ncbi:MAG: topoisomerase-4 subunit A [Candidatus Binatia bacterium]|jgi:topoisomerase-4 subunit A
MAEDNDNETDESEAGEQLELYAAGGDDEAPKETPPVRANSKGGNAMIPVKGSSRRKRVSADAVPLFERVDDNFLQYASYVIRDRAIPNVADGLKPVQRRILWALHEKDDGRFIKVANVVGHSMQYHPHGDASIGDALVVLTNKRYLIEGQGNFGNIFTGDRAAASRYIECRLTKLAREEIFNDELTEFVPSYDGRNKEPVTYPAKIPLLLMLGTEGIAVGMSARILPHNFIELLEAQVAILRKQPFRILPDFAMGCLMDASDYDDGRGSVRLRAKIERKNKTSNTLIVREISPTSTTESLMASIEDAAKKGKLKIRSMNDFTSEKIEVEIKLPAGVDPEQTIQALYAFSDCETSLSSRLIVIQNQRPVEMTVSQVLKFNTRKLVADLKAELELAERKLLQELHFKTLVQIFIENRIYKKIEECKTKDEVSKAVYQGFEPFKKQLIRKLVDKDIDMLLAVVIRRISLFDINKHRDDMEKVKAELEDVRANLKQLTRYAVKHLQRLAREYKETYSRRTQITTFDAVVARQVAIRAFKMAYDREKGYIGTKVSGSEYVFECSRFDKILLVFDDGVWKVTKPDDKLFVGKGLVHCEIIEKDDQKKDERVFTVAYERKGTTSVKRFTFPGFIMEKKYHCAPDGAKILLFLEGTPEQIYVKYKPAPRQNINQQIVHPADLAVKTHKSHGSQIGIKKISKLSVEKPRGWSDKEETTRVRFA